MEYSNCPESQPAPKVHRALNSPLDLRIQQQACRNLSRSVYLDADGFVYFTFEGQFMRLGLVFVFLSVRRHVEFCFEVLRQSGKC